MTNNVVTDFARRPVNVLGGQDVEISNNYLQANPTYYTAINIGSGSPQSPTPITSSNINIHDNILSQAPRQLYVEKGSSVAAFDTVGPLDAAASLLANAGPQFAVAPEKAATAVPAAASTTSVIKGGSGVDLLTGTDGADTIDGGSGADVKAGGKGDDIYVIGHSKDLAVESAGEGYGTAHLWVRDYVLADQVEQLVVKHDRGGVAAGNAQANVILGGAGNDIIVGGGGDDVLTSSGGADLFQFKRGDGSDTITDLSATDRIVLSGFDVESFDALRAAMSQRGADVVIDLGSSQSRTLKNVSLGALTAEQFDFGSTSTAVGWSETVIGTNRIAATAFNDAAMGTDGNDYINPGDGDDVMVGGKGDDL